MAKGMVPEFSSATPAPAVDSRVNEAIVFAIAKARRWLDELLAGASLTALAKQEGCTERHLRSVIQLAFVSPRIVQAIDDGGMPAGLNATRLVQALPQLWRDQERLHLLTA